MNLSRRAMVVAGTVTLVLVGLAALGAYALAQADGAGPPWRDGPAWHAGDRGWGGWRHGGPPDPEGVRQARADLAAELAAELNTSADEVEAAFRAVVASRLQEAVEEEEIDQATADDALAAYDEGDIRALVRAVKRDWKETSEGS
jgi:hypothetical protein